MRLILDFEYAKLLRKYGFNAQKYWPDRSPIKNLIKDIIIEELRTYEKIVIRGGGKHTEELLKLFPDSLRKKIICIIDNNPIKAKEKFPYFTIVSLDEFMTRNFETDAVVVSSFVFREDMLRELSTDLKFKVLDIYEILDQEFGIRFPGHGPLCSEENLMWIDLITNLYYMRFDYENSETKQEKQNTLKELIHGYLSIRDFVYALRYLDEYISLKLQDFNTMLNFREELNNFLEKITSRLRDREEKSIITLLVDNMNYEDFSREYTNFSDLKGKSLVFKNAISPSMHTLEIFNSIFSGKNLFEDEVADGFWETYNTFEDSLHNKINSWVDYSPWLQKLEKEGYFFYFYNTYLGQLQKLKDFNKLKDFINSNNSNFKIKNKSFYPITVLLWENICDLYDNESNFFSIVHSFNEMHGLGRKYSQPLCAYHNCEPITNENYSDERLRTQYLDSMRYTLTQINYYRRFLPKNSYMILFADHGNSSILKDNRIRVPLTIYNENYEHKEISELISLKNLGDIILALDADDLRFKNEGFVLAQLGPVRNNNLRNTLVSKGFKNWTTGVNIIRDYYDKYIIFGNGQEEYYLLANEDNNLINDKDFKERINEMREYANKFKDRMEKRCRIQ